MSVRALAVVATLNCTIHLIPFSALAVVMLGKTLNETFVIIRQRLFGKSREAISIGNSGHFFFLTYII